MNGGTQQNYAPEVEPGTAPQEGVYLWTEVHCRMAKLHYRNQDLPRPEAATASLDPGQKDFVRTDSEPVSYY